LCAVYALVNEVRKSRSGGQFVIGKEYKNTSKSLNTTTR
jgi:hypothetical protein